jgi:chitinase
VPERLWTGKDFKRTAGKLTFRPGMTKLKIAVPIVPDNKKEKLERLTLALSAPAGATLAKATGTGTITDDD